MVGCQQESGFGQLVAMKSIFPVSVRTNCDYETNLRMILDDFTDYLFAHGCNILYSCLMFLKCVGRTLVAIGYYALLLIGKCVIAIGTPCDEQDIGLAEIFIRLFHIMTQLLQKKLA